MNSQLLRRGFFPLAVLAVGCSGSGTSGDRELVGTAALAITNAPPDGTCIQVTASSYRTVTKSFDVVAGASTVLSMNGLPTGAVTFTAQAFGGKCAQVNSGSVPNWTSAAPFTATVGVKPPVLITISLVRNGNASVAVDFNDMPDSAVEGSSGGGTTDDATAPGGSAPPPPPPTPAFMTVPGITGGSLASGFAGAFDITGFNLSVTLALSTSGAGGGVGRATWAASATLQAQQGAPDLLALGSSGKVTSSVQFALERDGTQPSVALQATLTNVTISGVSTTQSSGLGTEMLTFGFQKVDLVYTPLNADGSTGTPTGVTFDVTAGGTAPTGTTADFVLGGPASPPSEAIMSFRAPSLTLPQKFSDSTITLPVDPSVLNAMALAANGRVLQTTTVEVFTGTPPALFGSYAFSAPQFDLVSLSLLAATESFLAPSFTWTVGQDTASFP